MVCGICWTVSSVRAEQASQEWLAPPAAAERKSPVSPSEQSIAHGHALFANCLICHGPAGHGDGAAAIALNPKPKDLTNAATQDQTDGALFWKITQGRAPMPPWEQALSNEDRWDLVNYIRTLSPHGLADQATRSKQPAADVAPVKPAGPAVHQEDLDDIFRQMRTLEHQVHSSLPGTEHLLIAGDAAVGFTNQRKTNSTFSAGVAPLILWQPTDRLLFEAALDIGIDTDPSAGSSTSVDLKIADASFIVNDYLIVGGGLFVVPFAQYHNHFDPSWITKLPDDPLAFGDGGLAPGSQVGIFARGAVPIGSSKVVYDVYLTNGPQLVTNDPEAAGSLNFDDFTDLNNGKAVGGRIGFLPVPWIETGYSVEYAQTAPNGFPHTYALLQAFDLNIRKDVHSLGVFRVHTEWIWSNIERRTYGGGSTGFGPLTYSNYRIGGYAELSYRPTYCPHPFIQNLEFVARYNVLRTPLSAPGGDHEQRWEFGIDYWLTPSAVIKVAYEVDDKKVGTNQNAFMVQFGIGL